MALLFLISLSLGIITGYYIDLSCLIYITGVYFLSLLIKAVFYKINRGFLLFIILPVIFFIGAYYIVIYCDLHVKPEYKVIGKELSYECTVSDVPEKSNGKTKFTAKIEKINNQDIICKSKVYITLDKNNEEISYKDRLRVKAVLNKPYGPMNHGEFDYSLYLKTKDIFFTSFIQMDNVEIILKNNKIASLKDAAMMIRKLIQDNIDNFYNDEAGQLLKGMIIGDRSGFTEEMDVSISKSGLMHITAVSGMHTAILLMGIFFILKNLKINKTAANIIGILCIVLFMLITGARPSVLRSGIMLIIYLIGDIFYKERDTLNFLFVSAFLILIYNPAVIFSAGFQLSFFATLSILVFTKPIYEFIANYIKKDYLKYPLNLLSVSIAALIGTAPLIAYHFNTFSFISIISNLIVLPIVPFILIGGIIFSLTFNISGIIGEYIGYFLYSLLKYILFASKILYKAEFLSSNVKTPGFNMLTIYILFCLGLYIFLKPEFKKRKKYVLTIIVLILILTAVNIYISLYNQSFPVVSFINVGQGDSILIEYKGKTFLIDGGGSYSYDVGERILYPYLLRRGINKIDIVFVSHFHEDHVKGIMSIMNKVDINRIMVSNGINQTNKLIKAFIEKSKKNNIFIDIIEENNIIKVDDYFSMLILSPDNTMDFSDFNNTSLVIKMVYNNISFLFTGDIEESGEEYLITKGKNIMANVLKIPHHGAFTLKTKEFIKKVKPEYAIVCVGRNKFGHPSKKLLDFLYYNDIIILRTDNNGDIRFKLNKEGIKDVKYLKGFINEY